MTIVDLSPDAKCNRTACQRSLVRPGRKVSVWFNKGNQLLYCGTCARQINKFNMTGKPLLEEVEIL